MGRGLLGEPMRAEQGYLLCYKMLLAGWLSICVYGKISVLHLLDTDNHTELLRLDYVRFKIATFGFSGF